MIVGCFVDFGLWYIGFGIVLFLCKSEVLVIMLVLFDDGEFVIKCCKLYEFVYLVYLYGDDIVIVVLELLVVVFVFVIDIGMIDMDDFVVLLVLFFFGKFLFKFKCKVVFL